MTVRRDLHQKNRLSWNAVTEVHNRSKGDQAAFFRQGGDTLHAEELELLGDVAGRRLVHLQCNCGQDSLSLARRGALVTGVDIGDEPIAFARRLSQESGVPADFVRADVYDWLEETGGARFDVAFASYGALPWLSDLETWARGVASVLVPGGRLVVVEFHPAAMMFDEAWRLRDPYSSGGEPIEDVGVGDYVAGAPFENPHRDYGFNWGIGDVVEAIHAAGFALEALHEYGYSNFEIWDEMREGPEGRFLPPAHLPALPLMVGFAARR
jgi:SAM-dependent methyltransferase